MKILSCVFCPACKNSRDIEKGLLDFCVCSVKAELENCGGHWECYESSFLNIENAKVPADRSQCPFKEIHIA